MSCASHRLCIPVFAPLILMALSNCIFRASELVAHSESGERDANRAINLMAGPIRLKFADGELRYLYVGDKEILRRIYFAVRDMR